MSTLDSVLNTGIPILLLVVALGFIYVKFLKPWVIPMLQNLWEWMKGKQQESASTDMSNKVITFE